MAESLIDSGFGWVGQIPSTWVVNKNKYVFINSKNLVGKNWESTQLLSLTKNGVKEKDINEGGGKQPDSFSTYQYVKKSDLVMCLFDLDQSAVFSGISKYDGMISPAYKLLKCNEEINPEYASYWFDFVFDGRKFKTYSKNIRYTLDYDEFGKLPILTPPLEEQKRIADFLDEKCAEIDKLSEDTQKQIEILEDYKKSIIIRAVTKGIEANPETINSSIYYNPVINKDWKTTKIGYICEKLWQKFSPDDVPLICSNSGEVVARSDDKIGKMVSEDHAMQGIKKGNIAIHGMDTWHGAIALSNLDGKITRVVHVCDSKDCDNRFIVYYLQNLAYIGVYKLISFGIRENTSDFRSWDKVKDIYISVPQTLTEQKNIADYLDEVKREIGLVIASKQDLIAKLLEYKKSIIFEYVTGKKRVA